MKNTLILAAIALSFAPRIATADEPPVLEIISNGITLAQDRNARLVEVIAPNGIKTSAMQQDGTVEINLKDGTTRDLRVDFIGGYTNGSCYWAPDFPFATQLETTLGSATQTRLINDDWPETMTGTNAAMTAAECIARSTVALFGEGCHALIPLEQDGLSLHLAYNIPELCS